MNLLHIGPALERLTGAPTLAVSAGACVRHWNRESACQVCADACPVGAITLAPVGDAGLPSVTLDAEACVQCGYCLHACPTGVFSGRDETGRLLETVAAIEPRAVVDLTCRHFPARTAGPDIDGIVEVGSCLAALGAAAYAGLAALGVERISVRLEACSECPARALAAAVKKIAAAAAAVTSVPITIQDTAAPAAGPKPVYATYAPKVARRSLWNRFAGSKATPVSPLPAQEEPPPGSKCPPPERRSLLHALAHLPGDRRSNAPAFPTLTADGNCTACGVCAGVCPTGALALAAEGERFSLQFAPLACTECGLCTQLCAPGALHPAGRVRYDDAHPVVLQAGELRACKRCRAAFAGAGELCPACAFRRKNPAGMWRRPAPVA